MMKTQKSTVVNLKAPDRIDGSRIGRLVRRDDDGRVWVDYDGNRNGPTVAKLCGAVCNRLSTLPDISGISVMMVFEDGLGDRPVVVDVIHNNLNAYIKEACLEVEEKPDITSMDAIVDGRKMTFKAKEQIVFQTGKSSITLTRNGKIVIRGAYVLTRSSGINRILGGSVRIN